MPSRRPWRLLRDAPADGAWNMAVDEALLVTCGAARHGGVPTLRLYGWRPPALSLGRAQRAAGSHDATYLREHGIDLVRRPTGGRAVLHEHERTYAVIARRGGAFPGGVVDTYARISRALHRAMVSLGAAVDAFPPAPSGAEGRVAGPLCFARGSVHEIGARGRKLAGSAQLRRAGAFLQHGSLLLRADPERLGRAVGVAADGEAFTDLERVLGRRPDDREVDDAIGVAFEQVFGVRLDEGDLTPGERALATRLRAFKYLSAAWTLGGHSGFSYKVGD